MKVKGRKSRSPAQPGVSISVQWDGGALPKRQER
ncbi:hypothetical protein ACVISU_007251 [Bradyrhizobium sp. USDA 4452]